jgi:hypothetical protein
MIYFRIDDQHIQRGCFLVLSNAEAVKWNSAGWGIFLTFNDFRDNIRRIDHCIKINTWLIDIDIKPESGLTKALAWKKINRSPLLPSMVNESKNGFHCYWFAKDATQENWKEIEQRLIARFDADLHASDITRILRAPNFYHCKDINDRFLVRTVMSHDVRYSEREMLMFFQKRKMPVIRQQQQATQYNNAPQKGAFWEKVHAIPCDYALLKLSGHIAIGGDKITLRPNSNGTQQIWANGKSTALWIDANKKIGGNGGGAPNIATWINWYHKNWKTTYQYIVDVFGVEFDLCKN